MGIKLNKIFKEKLFIYILLLTLTPFIIYFSSYFLASPIRNSNLVQSNSPTLAPQITITPIDTNYKNIKESILQSTLRGHNSGIVYESSNLRIEYVSSQDIFIAEIVTTDIPKAKLEGNSWFISQGLNQDGICKLPLKYFISPILENALDKKTPFNPLPEGC